MAQKKRQPVQRPPIRANPPPKGAWMKQISRNLKAIRPPKIGGRKR